MAQACDVADGKALTAIAEAIAHEAQIAEGEARAGRARLLQNINQKLTALGEPTVSASSTASTDNAYDLISREVENEALCAHTRNFLQVSLSRLERFDTLH